jgi:hypothetical protein
MTDSSFDISSISSIESYEDIDDYDEEAETLENMREELTNLENTIKESCHNIQDFIFEISESNKISQNEYLKNSNDIKNIFDSHKKSIHFLSNINNVISLNYEEKNFQLIDAMNQNKQLKNLVEDLKLKINTNKFKNSIKSYKDKLKRNVSLNTIYTQYYNNTLDEE